MNLKRTSSYLTRRGFFGKSACATMGLTGLVDTIARLKLMQGALAQGSPGDYKALVVLFLQGGNDSNNMLIPRIGHSQYGNYKSGRGALGIVDEDDPEYEPNDNNDPDYTYDHACLPLSLAEEDANGDDSYGVHPEAPEIQGLFEHTGTGGLSFVSNVGTLYEPVERSNYGQKKPHHLYSHSDQQVQWQSSRPDQPFSTGWGGLAADLLAPTHQNSDVSLSISLAGLNSLQVGSSVDQYAITPSGAIAPMTPGDPNNNPYVEERMAAFRTIADDAPHAHLLEDGYKQVVATALANEEIISGAANGPNAADIDNIFDNGLSGFNTRPATSNLGKQLKMVSKLIDGRGAVGNNRQIFFCQAKGYNTHAGQMSAHAELMEELSRALGAFFWAMNASGAWEDVLLVTASDFSRTLVPNSTGTDHAWGSHQVVMGGPVESGRIFGTFPNLEVGGGDDTTGADRGRWIPTTSVDQYASVAANWMGVTGTGLDTVFPNLGRFDDPTDPQDPAYDLINYLA